MLSEVTYSVLRDFTFLILLRKFPWSRMDKVAIPQTAFSHFFNTWFILPPWDNPKFDPERAYHWTCIDAVFSDIYALYMIG